MRASRLLRTTVAALMLAAAAARAQAPAPASPPGSDLRRLCETISMNPADGKELARRSECVLSGVLPSTDRIAEARMLAKAALAAGEPSGGLMLYLVFQADPRNQFVRGGQADPQAYRRLAARSLQQRQEQVEAIEGLGFAAGRNHAAAGVLLATYFHDTVAPRNVQRTGAITALLLRNGERTPVVERFAHEADAIVQGRRRHAGFGPWLHGDLPASHGRRAQRVRITSRRGPDMRRAATEIGERRRDSGRAIPAPARQHGAGQLPGAGRLDGVLDLPGLRPGDPGEGRLRRRRLGRSTSSVRFNQR